jgi:hypothetical protein
LIGWRQTSPEALLFQTSLKTFRCGFGSRCNENAHRYRGLNKADGAQQTIEIGLGFRHSASTQHKHSSATFECFRNRPPLDAIHHWITESFGGHPMAAESSGGELISHGDPLATLGAHQHPFPWIPFTAFQSVISIA